MLATFRSSGISEVLVTPRYLVKTRRLHRQRLQQNAQEYAESSYAIPDPTAAEDAGDAGDAVDAVDAGDAGEEPTSSSPASPHELLIPKTEMVEEEDEEEEAENHDEGSSPKSE